VETNAEHADGEVLYFAQGDTKGSFACEDATSGNYLLLLLVGEAVDLERFNNADER
jgi:hypothetical protein